MATRKIDTLEKAHKIINKLYRELDIAKARVAELEGELKKTIVLRRITPVSRLDNEDFLTYRSSVLLPTVEILMASSPSDRPR